MLASVLIWQESRPAKEKIKAYFHFQGDACEPRSASKVGDVAQANILATWRKWRTKILEGRMLGKSGRPSRFWEAIEALSDPF